MATLHHTYYLPGRDAIFGACAGSAWAWDVLVGVWTRDTQGKTFLPSSVDGTSFWIDERGGVFLVVTRRMTDESKEKPTTRRVLDGEPIAEIVRRIPC